jgi:hypothetical protein
MTRIDANGMISRGQWQQKITFSRRIQRGKTGTMPAFGSEAAAATQDQQSVDNTARGDGNAEGRQR